ncbi:hypothetical protein AX17_005639 [Amanita inopinata Kibby_2008]|nr:hypothetical protein AX17_005639 [Amanita inopinata Kibby_2008]
MKFSVLFGAVVSTSCFTVISAGPAPHPQPLGTHHHIKSECDDAVGAFYTITNQPTGNYILSAEIACNGHLTYKTATYAGGNGSSGIDPALPNGGDALSSQGSIGASSANGVVATINAGSNTVVAFKVNPGNPGLLRMIGEPVPSGGEFPMSVALNSAGTVVCVLNGGAVNGVSCFNIDKKKGLSLIPGSTHHMGVNETTPPFGAPGSLSQVIFSEDDKNLIVSGKGSTGENTYGYLAMWSVAPDGSLSEQFRTANTTNIGQAPFGISKISGSNALLVSDAALGYDIWSFSDGDLTTAQASVSTFPIPNQIASCWSAHSPTTGSYFIIDAADTITEISIDSNLNSQMIKQYPTKSGSFLLDADIATLGGTDFMYNLAAAEPAVYVYSISSPGNAQQIQTLDLAAPAARQGVVANLRGSQGAAVYLAKSK